MSEPIYYCETADFAGRWRPRLVRGEPQTTSVGGSLRMRGSAGQGPRVRAIRQVPTGMERLNVDQIRECLSPDGRFFSAHQDEGDV